MHAYATDESRTKGYAYLAVGAVMVAIVTNWIVEETGFAPTWLVSAPAVAGAFGLLFEVFDRWGWRAHWGPLRLSNTPNIEGRYDGELVSTFEGRTLPISLVVDQTWTRLGVRFEVLDNTTSTSRSLTARLERVGHAHAVLTYTYRSQVRPGVADADMGDHDGTAELTIDLSSNTASGRYYNYRGRQGTISVRRT